MNKLSMSASTREYKDALRALAIDEQGNEVLVGLSREESEALISDEENWFQERAHGTRSKADRARYIELHDKHELARLMWLGLASDPRGGTA